MLCNIFGNFYFVVILKIAKFAKTAYLNYKTRTNNRINTEPPELTTTSQYNLRYELP